VAVARAVPGGRAAGREKRQLAVAVGSGSRAQGGLKARKGAAVQSELEDDAVGR
jgi:hypothetical protein